MRGTFGFCMISWQKRSFARRIIWSTFTIQTAICGFGIRGVNGGSENTGFWKLDVSKRFPKLGYIWNSAKNTGSRRIALERLSFKVCNLNVESGKNRRFLISLMWKMPLNSHFWLENRKKWQVTKDYASPPPPPRLHLVDGYSPRLVSSSWGLFCRSSVHPESPDS